MKKRYQHKKRLITLVVFAVFVSSFITISSPSTTNALTIESTTNLNEKFTLTVDKTSALADGKDKIKITYGAFTNDPTNPQPLCIHDPDGSMYTNDAGLDLVITGSSITVTDTNSANLFKDDLSPYYSIESDSVRHVFDCNTGYAVAYLSSTKAETKTINVINPYPARGGSDSESSQGPKPQFSAPISVIFSDQLTTPSTTKPKTTTPVTPVAPTKPTLSLTTKAKINTQNVSLDITKDTTTQSILPTQKLTYSGVTSPNAKVTLTIHSDPITADVTADKDGNWTYTLDPTALNLPTGNHTVTAIATDTSGNKSDEITLATFELNPDPSQIPVPEPYRFTWKSLLTVQNYVLSGIFILLIGLLIFVDVKRRINSLPLKPEVSK